MSSTKTIRYDLELIKKPDGSMEWVEDDVPTADQAPDDISPRYDDDGIPWCHDRCVAVDTTTDDETDARLCRENQFDCPCPVAVARMAAELKQVKKSLATAYSRELLDLRQRYMQGASRAAVESRRQALRGAWLHYNLGSPPPELGE